MTVQPEGDASRLRVVYRSHGGENMKARPNYYSKLLALTSFLRALQNVEVTPEVIFLNDGPVPEERAALMGRFGEVIRVDLGSNRRSYRHALNLAARRPWNPDDLVWFAEDDYLYAPTSLQVLVAGMSAVPSGDYFSMYSPVDIAAGRSRPAAEPEPWPPGGGEPPIVVGGTTWFRALSTTSTFGVRAGVLRQDRRLLRLCPYTGGAWDHTSCLTVQGRRPFRWADLKVDLLPVGSHPVRLWPRSVLRGLARVAMNQRSRRRAERRRTLFAADPLPIWHLESSPEHGAEDRAGWAARAEQTRRWASERQIRLPSARSEPTDAATG
jgi:hypothetical protein